MVAKSKLREAKRREAVEARDPMPFDEALSRLVNTPPKHRVAKKAKVPRQRKAKGRA